MRRKIQLTESELINVIKKIINEQYDDRRDNLKNYILDKLDFDDYEIKKSKNPLRTGLKIFMSEYDHEIKRYGIKKAFIEYLQGLPSWISIPYSYYDIGNLLYSLGYDEVRDRNMEDDEIAELYYREIANLFLGGYIND
jgi:hypothetical protein